MVRVLPLMFALALAAAQAPTTSKPSADVGTAQPSLDEPIRAQFVGGARLAPDQSIPRAELEAFVDGVVRQAVGTHHLAGASVAVVQSGDVVFKRGYGLADLETGRRVDPDGTLFRIGSITKTFTWIALMKAVEAGRIGLDDPVNEHLPPELRIPDQGFSEPIRIRHLPTHASGFEARALGHLFEKDAAQIRSLAKYLREERPARVRDPGLLSSYSNYGAALAGAILQQVDGRSWQDIIEADIIGALGMTHSSAREPYPARDDLPALMSERLAANLSKGYRWTDAGHVVRELEYLTQIAPAGVISSTARDMAQYMLMLLNDGLLDGVRVFGPQAARAFRTPMTKLPRVVGNWAAGFETRATGAFTSFSHDGATPSFLSSLVLVPELRLGVFVTTNTSGGANLAGALPARIVDHFYAPPPNAPTPRSPAVAASAQVYEGHYLMTVRAYGGLEGFLSRLQTSQVVVTPDGYLTLPVLGRTQRFGRTEQVDVFTSVDRRGLIPSIPGLLFNRKGDRATRIESYQLALERVGPVFQPQTLYTLGVLTLVASLGTLLGVWLRASHGLYQTNTQRLAGAVQAVAAIAWLISAGAAGAFALNAANLLYTWPPPAILIFSSAALVATLLAVTALLLLPAVWRRGRDTAGWTWWRKLRFTLATTVFVLYGGFLALWGALQPWNP